MPREKSIFTREYRIFLAQLRRARTEAGVTQEEVASAMGWDQSSISKCERGERRLDIIEAIYYCNGIGLDFRDFADLLLTDLRPAPKKRKAPKRHR